MNPVDYFRQALMHFLRTRPDVSQKGVAEALGISPKSVNDFIHGRINFSEERREKVAAVFGIQYVDMLIIGRRLVEGKPPEAEAGGLTVADLPSPECRLVDHFSEAADLPDRWRHLRHEFVAVPLVSHQVAAGQPIIAETFIEGWSMIHASRLHRKKDLVAIRVKGASMHPTLRDGSIICVDRHAQEVRNGQIYAIAYEDGAVVKRAYQKGPLLQLVSDNTAAEFREPILIDLKGYGYNPVIGRVVWAWTEFDEPG